MADKRMFSIKIIDSDAFTDMPLSTQALYFHLSMRADDDGFVNNPKKIQRMIGAADDDMKILVGKRFILCFDTGVIVIKHWRLNNYIRGDRYRETLYQEELSQLYVKENGAYTDHQIDVGIPGGIPVGIPMVDVDKNRIDKNRLEENNNIGQIEDYKQEFEELWKLYPNKKGKYDALKHYIKARKQGTTFNEVKQGIENYNADIKKNKTDKTYIKHGSTWFNQHSWNDEYDKPQEREYKEFWE